MPSKPLLNAEKIAIHGLIHAKSDQEIARILRQSYQLLNLHRRRRSSISHRERWTDYEIRLLGRMWDEELAKWLHRSPATIAARRESLGIRIVTPQRSHWSTRELELLGKRPDPVVARMLGRTRYVVQLKRHSLGILQCWEGRHPWTPEEGLRRGGQKRKRQRGAAKVPAAPSASMKWLEAVVEQAHDTVNQGDGAMLVLQLPGGVRLEVADERLAALVVMVGSYPVRSGLAAGSFRGLSSPVLNRSWKPYQARNSAPARFGSQPKGLD